MKAKSFILVRECTKQNLGGGEKICMKFSSVSMSYGNRSLKYFDFHLENADLDHLVRFVISDGAV